VATDSSSAPISAGSVVPLTDAQGSVLALADSTGTFPTQYSYGPIGNTVASGTASGNSFQYIGSENDGNGLYFMQARYYSPVVYRFISEDPIGFAGGDINLHGYSFASPTNFENPNGTDPAEACLYGATISVIWEAGSKRRRYCSGGLFWQHICPSDEAVYNRRTDECRPKRTRNRCR
jgi:RHS repeat-associated protein